MFLNVWSKIEFDEWSYKLQLLIINCSTVTDEPNIGKQCYDRFIFEKDDIITDVIIEILAEKAFTNNWFKETHSLDITKTDLTDLLKLVTKNQLFQFYGNLYEQFDGVAMGSPLGPLNAFLCSIEQKLEFDNKLNLFTRILQKVCR